MAYHRTERRTSKTGVMISVLLHAIVILALFFLAAREGMLGRDLKKIAITLVPRLKVPEMPKVKPPEKAAEPQPAKVSPPAEPQVVESPQIAKTPPSRSEEPVAAPPSTPVSPSALAPSIAPPPAVISGFDFSGGRVVETSSDPKALYRNFVEFTLRSNWKRPQNIQDTSYSAMVEIAIDPAGQITQSEWKRGSGDNAWDRSVQQAVAQTRSIGRAPPQGFPGKVMVRFDVQPQAEALIP